jgi:predicted Zn-ribbon and HTH transcriptional regulator
MSPLWDFYFGPGSPWDRQSDVDAYDAATSARKEAEQARKSVDQYQKELSEKIDRLALICRAMWELLRERSNITEEALLEKVREVDLLDGQLDGKATVPPKKCSQCGRTVSKRHMRCIYCGSEELFDTAFDAL